MVYYSFVCSFDKRGKKTLMMFAVKNELKSNDYA